MPWGPDADCGPRKPPGLQQHTLPRGTGGWLPAAPALGLGAAPTPQAAGPQRSDHTLPVAPARPAHGPRAPCPWYHQAPPRPQTPRRCLEEAAGGQGGARSRLGITGLRFLLEQNNYSPHRGPEFPERCARRQLGPSPKADERLWSRSGGGLGWRAGRSPPKRQSPGAGPGCCGPSRIDGHHTARSRARPAGAAPAPRLVPGGGGEGADSHRGSQGTPRSGHCQHTRPPAQPADAPGTTGPDPPTGPGPAPPLGASAPSGPSVATEDAVWAVDWRAGWRGALGERCPGRTSRTWDPECHLLRRRVAAVTASELPGEQAARRRGRAQGSREEEAEGMPHCGGGVATEAE